MGELERDVSCTKERNPRGQLVELEESCARDKVLLSRNAEVSRFGSGGDHEVPRFEHLAINRQLVWAHEPSRAMIGRDASLLRSEEHTSELQSQSNLVCRLLLEKKKKELRP